MQLCRRRQQWFHQCWRCSESARQQRTCVKVLALSFAAMALLLLLLLLPWSPVMCLL